MTAPRSLIVNGQRTLLLISLLVAGCPIQAPSSGQITVVGRVLDQGRFPQKGIAVRWSELGGRSGVTATDAVGRFRFMIPKDSRYPSVHAWDGRTQAASGGVSEPLYPGDPHHVEELILRESQTLTVSVAGERGNPVSNASVVISQFPYADFLTIGGHTGQDGTVRFSGIHLEPWRNEFFIRASASDGRSGLVFRTTAFEVGSKVSVRVERARPLHVLVLDARTERPLSDARLLITSNRDHCIHEIVLPKTVPPSDTQGRVTVSDLTADDPGLGVEASLPGYVTEAREDVQLGQLTLRLRPAPECRWPLVVEGTHVPADGTRVVLHDAWGAGKHEIARIEGSELIATRRRDRQNLLATAGDGSMARVTVPWEGKTGSPVTSRRPRPIELLLREGGRPTVGQEFILTLWEDHGKFFGYERVLVRRVRTTSAGRVFLQRVVPGAYLLDVRRESSHMLRQAIHLTRESGPVVLDLPPTRELSLTFTVDGSPGLPPRFRFVTPIGWPKCQVRAEDPSTGRVRLACSGPGVHDRPIQLTIRARGFEDASVEVQPAKGSARVALKTANRDRR